MRFTVHRTSYVLASGSMFIVPRGSFSSLYALLVLTCMLTGNMYYIKNISDRDAKLFFAQARKMIVAGSEGSMSRSPSKSRSRSASRTSER